jgi:hypothetical protein
VRAKPRQDFAERVDDAAAIPCGEFDRGQRVGQIVHLPRRWPLPCNIGQPRDCGWPRGAAYAHLTALLATAQER